MGAEQTDEQTAPLADKLRLRVMWGVHAIHLSMGKLRQEGEESRPACTT